MPFIIKPFLKRLTKDLAIELYKQGYSYVEIGETFGVSRQRVHQVLKDYRNSGKSGRARFYRNWGKCQKCKSKIATALHHKDFNNSHDKMSNLERLCKECHYEIHTEHRKKLGEMKLDRIGKLINPSLT